MRTMKRFMASYTVHSNGDITTFYKCGDEEFGGFSRIRAIGNYFEALYTEAEGEAERHGGELNALAVDQEGAR